MELTLLFLVLWLLLLLALRALIARLKPEAAGRRGTLLAAGVVALAITYPLMERIRDSSPAALPAEARWPDHARPPAPRRADADELARVPFTTVHEDGLAARATFVEASRRRPVARMALRLADEATRQVQRYLVLRGDTLELLIDERRRPDGEGQLYALPLEEVVLAACEDGAPCRVADAAAVTAGGGGRFRILGRFPGDTAWAVRF